MKRAEIRKIKEEQKFIRDLMKNMKHYFKDLISELDQVEDKRHQSYITYSTSELLFTMLLGKMVGVESMNRLTIDFNNSVIIDNVKKMIDNQDMTELPHGDTINDFFEILNPQEISNIRKYMIKELFKKRCLEQFRLLDKYWLIAVDATGIQSYRKRHCKHCLKRVMKNEETGEEKILYYHNVLEAKLIAGDMVFSIATEFIENENENVSKQDCERNAFRRMAEKLKKEYKRLPICILADSLYASNPVMNICKDNNWEYIIRFKDGSIQSIADDFDKLKNNKNKKEKVITHTDSKVIERYRWVNKISYRDNDVNVYEMDEKTEKKKNTTERKCKFISSLKATPKNILHLVENGRKRWKIENEGFNTQKNHGYNI